jgi:hypothetical protein
MTHKFRFLTARLTLGICIASAASARSEDLDGRIKAMEAELATLKDQQVEMKKEATAAAEALPSFTYRPGNGLMIESPDKGWSLRAGIETHCRVLFESGRDQVGRSQGDVFARRFRPNMYYCINNCL